MGRTESPIEAQFLAAWERLAPHLPLETQYRVRSAPYRLDFAYLPAKIAIELDGYEYHANRNQFTRDRKKDRELQALGWQVFRFSGREINANVDACVLEVRSVIHNALPPLPTHTPYPVPAPTASPAPSVAPRNRPVQRKASCFLVGLVVLAIGGCMLVAASLASSVWPSTATLAVTSVSQTGETVPPTATTGSNASIGIAAEPLPIPPLPTGRVTAQELNVRLSPDPTSPAFGHLGEGTVVNILEEVTPPAGGRWMRIREHDASGLQVLEGWVNARYVVVDPVE